MAKKPEPADREKLKSTELKDSDFEHIEKLAQSDPIVAKFLFNYKIMQADPDTMIQAAINECAYDILKAVKDKTLSMKDEYIGACIEFVKSSDKMKKNVAGQAKERQEGVGKVGAVEIISPETARKNAS